MSDEIVIGKDEYLIREGEMSTQMYYLKDGTMVVYKVKGDQEKEIGHIYSGELVGEMSFLDKSPRCASVKALSECRLVVIPSEKFEHTLASLPTWYRALVNTLLDRLRRANARIKI